MIPATTAVARTACAAFMLMLSGCALRGAPTPPAPDPGIVETTVPPVAVTSAGWVHGDRAVADSAPEPLHVVEGEATYYASLFDGRRTASGITFHNSEMYAAHPSFPFGTLLRVTNLANQRSVIVNVVDRGPSGARAAERGRIIDLSQKAAADLDFIRQGHTLVRIEVLEWGG
jgi:rare lipoprotein A